MKGIFSRTVAIFTVLVVLLCFGLLRVFTVASGTRFADAAEQNSFLTLTAVRERGSVYDCNFHSMNSTEDGYIAAVVPSPQATQALSTVLQGEEMEGVLERLGEDRPFLVKVPRPIEAEGITLFPNRSGIGEGLLAPHIIGYTDNTGEEGMTGIESAYNSLLANGGSIRVRWTVNALGQPLAGVAPQVFDTLSDSRQGVVLTMDRDIQRIAEEAAKSYIKKGAVVVMDVETGEIRASVSMPAFSIDDIAAAMESADSPLVNRAFSEYNVGSAFKLVVASAALESGMSPFSLYDCPGAISVGDVRFSCYNGHAHGIVNMEEAIAVSCNGWFVTAGQKIGAAKLVDMASRYGFGKETVFCDGLRSLAGNLPQENTLAFPAALANVSFGQGELMATPVQLAAMVSTIANGGIYKSPSLIKGTMDASGTFLPAAQASAGTRVVSEEIARSLRMMMAGTVEYGTSVAAMPDTGGAGGKTSTAETGIYSEGEQVDQSWFVGFFPFDNPKYAVAILAENNTTSRLTAVPAFRTIANGVNMLENR